jgi:DNA-binding MarR family transcriptional regulator
VLTDLLKNGFVERKTGMQDRRTRRLQLTQKGKVLADSIWDAQRPTLVAAFKSAGQDAVNGFRKVLLGMIADEARLRSKP